MKHLPTRPLTVSRVIYLLRRSIRLVSYIRKSGPRTHRYALITLFVISSLTLSGLFRGGWFQTTARAANTFVVTNVNNSGTGSLRQAMIDANINPGLDTISFNIGTGPQTISPLQVLPFLTDPVVIDGTTQPGFSGTPIIELDGSNLVEGSGLRILGGASTVRALVINRFHFDGIAFDSNGGNRVEGCYIGTDMFGTTARPNGGDGISIPVSNNVIGGTTSAARNVISGNFRGIRVMRACCTGNETPITGNVIQGNYIGVNAAGNEAIPNGREGIWISSVNANVPVTGNLVGGTEPGAGNLISGNGFEGVSLEGFQVANNTVQGNFVGTDRSGSFAISNIGTGVEVSGNGNIVGGSAPGARNIISGNGRNASGIGGGSGVAVGVGSGNIVQGNIIGANAALTAPIPNFEYGVVVGGTNSIIGGVGIGEANVIAFNGFDGIGSAASTALANSFRGNSIFSNGALNHPSGASIGIDLGSSGVTPNDAGDADTGSNNLQNFPVITSVTVGATSVNVKGTLNSTANTSFSLDFYANSVCDALNFGEGARLIGSAPVTTNGGGDATFDLTFPGSLPSNQLFTATATNPTGNTSEFSQCFSPAPAIGSVVFTSTSSFVEVSETDSVASFELSRIGGSAGSLTVGFEVRGETANPGSDFNPTSGTVTFADGETSKTFTISIINDDLNEALSETAKITLNTSGNLDTIGPLSTARLTIIDDDPPYVLIGDVISAEGDSGTTDFFLTVTLSNRTARNVTLNFDVVDGTATGGGNDYSPLSTSVVIPATQLSALIVVRVFGDLNVEPDETFFVNITSATNAIIFDGQGKGTIRNDDSPGAIQFSASTATASETPNATTRIDLTVARNGDTSAPASVNYGSSNGTANDRSDYQAAYGTVRFLAGETTKTIPVFIVDDSFLESPETFSVTLSDPVGGSLGVLSTVTVTINSDDPVNGPNPVRDASFSSDFFVRQHYVDFLNRAADPGGLAFWKNQIDECTTQECREVRRINVSAAFFLSIEFQETGYLVYKANQAAFNSGEQLRLQTFLADTQEIGRGIIIGQPGADLQLETNKQNFFLDFVQRPAFLGPTAYPTNLTAQQFVDKLNGNTFDPLNPGSGPALTPSQRDDLVTQLSANPISPTLRAQVLRAVSENGIFTQRQFNKAFVLMQYFGYLRRNPDDAPDFNFGGYNFWLAKLNEFNGNFVNAEMVKAFITSGEYIQRFGP